MKSPKLLYLFYKDHGEVYFGDKSGFMQEEQPKEAFEYESDLNSEIRLNTENGGKIVHYNYKEQLITPERHKVIGDTHFDSKRYEGGITTSFPIALINKEKDIMLIYGKYSEFWKASGVMQHYTYSDVYDNERTFDWYDEEKMALENGFKRLGED